MALLTPTGKKIVHAETNCVFPRLHINDAKEA